MSTDRLYLVHKPTGKDILLGKLFGEGWYVFDPSNMGYHLNEFLQEVGYIPGNEFCLETEIEGRFSHAETNIIKELEKDVEDLVDTIEKDLHPSYLPSKYLKRYRGI